MPVTVQIPDTGEFLETTVADFSNVSGMVAAGNYLHLCGGLATGKYLRISKDLASHTTLTFPGDGKHEVPIDICYAPSPINRVYVLFINDGGTQLTVGVVNPDTPAIMSDLVNADSGGDFTGAISMTTDGASLYIVSEVDLTSQLLKYRLSDGAGIGAGFTTGFTLANGIRYANNKLFVKGAKVPNQGWVMRLSTAFAIEQSAIWNATGGAGLTHDFAVQGSYVWIGNKNTDGIVKRFLQTDLTNESDVATNQVSKSAEVDSDGTNVWALFENGRGARINPNTSAVSLYTVNQGQGFQREIAGDGTYIFTAT